jgi:hypothetical protein
VGTAPILRRLDWRKTSLPSARELARLRALAETRPMDERPSVSFRVARHRKKHEDGQEVGFAIVGHVEPAPEDASHQPRTYTAWRALQRGLDRE